MISNDNPERCQVNNICQVWRRENEEIKTFSNGELEKCKSYLHCPKGNPIYTVPKVIGFPRYVAWNAAGKAWYYVEYFR